MKKLTLFLKKQNEFFMFRLSRETFSREECFQNEDDGKLLKGEGSLEAGFDGGHDLAYF